MKLPHPLNVKEQYLYAIATKLDEVVELLKAQHAPKPATRKKKEA